MRELYEAASRPASTANAIPKWLRIQDLAFSGADHARHDLDGIVQETACRAVRLPMLRTAARDTTFRLANGHSISLKQGKTTIILDMVRKRDDENET
jgi:hypothetical protein